MKIRDKETGEIMEVELVCKDENLGRYNVVTRFGEQITVKNFADLFEDYEEPSIYWYITSLGEVVHRGFSLKKWGKYDDDRKQMGNYFSTKEEAEKAVEKLKAWKRLKDKGLKFKGISGYDEIHFWFPNPDDMFENSDIRKDLDLLFGGEE